MWKGVLYFTDYVCIDQDIWFASDGYNGLYRYQLEEKKLERMAVFPYESFGQSGLFLKMCQYKKTLIFVPQYSKRLYIFNTESMLLVDIKIPKMTENVEPPYFCEAVVYEDNLFMMGAKYPGIVKFDFQKNSIEVIDQWINELQDEVHLDMREIFLGLKGVREKDSFFIPCYQCNRVLEYEMSTGQYRFHKIGSDENRYARLIKSGDTFVAVTHDSTDTGHIVFWNYNDGYSKDVSFNMKSYFDREIVEYAGYIWIFSYISNEICRVEESGETSYYIVPETKKAEIVFVKTLEEGLFFSDYVSQSWYKVNSFMKVEKVGSWMKECVSLSELEEMLLTEAMPNGIIRENGCYSLEYLIKKASKTVALGSVGKSNAGKDIYNLSSSRKEY